MKIESGWVLKFAPIEGGKKASEIRKLPHLAIQSKLTKQIRCECKDYSTLA